MQQHADRGLEGKPFCLWTDRARLVAGKGLVFQCLQENLGSPDFGAACKEQVEQQSMRMQEDYRLDYGLASKCEADVARVCAAEQVRPAAVRDRCWMSW